VSAMADAEDLFGRLERERLEADREYNEALTSLDRALQAVPALPTLPPGYDETRVAELNALWKTLPEGEPSFDRSLKGRIRGLVWRLVAPVFQAQQRFNAAVVDHANRSLAAAADRRHALDALVELARREAAALVRFEWLLLQLLQRITAYVDTKDRSAGGVQLRDELRLLQQRVASMERDVARRLEGAVAAAPAGTAPGPLAADAVTYVGFEDRFRGRAEDIRARLEVYAPLFAGASDVLDIGCGRGEFLELLRARGIGARGIDANRAMVDVCRERGLEADVADALAYLDARSDGSLGGLVAIQVVEHLEPAYLLQLLQTAYLKLRPGAPLVLETVNVASWMAYFECYLRDLTHVRPLHPDTLRYLVQASGFTGINVEYRQPVAHADRLDRIELPPAADPALAAIVAVVNLHADKLNARLFAPMDYAVVARR
jgi:2-polyprenyl-3-methyl-5-hydroxy-6-metoxy-1,4-benzoquinol methylase